MGKDLEKDIRKKTKITLGAVDQRSFHSHISEESFCTSSSEDVMDMVLQEKESAMNPEKENYLGTVQDTSILQAAPPQNKNRRESKVSTGRPGAFRVGDVSSEESTVSSDGSESCVIVVPRASLVEDKQDVEAQMTKIPMVVADKAVESDESVARKPRARRSRMFRFTVLICLFLIIVLLTGVIIALMDRKRNASPAHAQLSYPPKIALDSNNSSHGGDGRNNGNDDGGKGGRGGD